MEFRSKHYYNLARFAQSPRRSPRSRGDTIFNWKLCGVNGDFPWTPLKKGSACFPFEQITAGACRTGSIGRILRICFSSDTIKPSRT